MLMAVGKKANKYQVKTVTRTKDEAVSIAVLLPRVHTCAVHLQSPISRKDPEFFPTHLPVTDVGSLALPMGVF